MSKGFEEVLYWVHMMPGGGSVAWFSPTGNIEYIYIFMGSLSSRLGISAFFRIRFLLRYKAKGFIGCSQLRICRLRSGHLCIKDAQCAETKEKSYIRFFRFLVFELLTSKMSQKMRKELNFLQNLNFWPKWFFSAILSFWDMIAFVFFPL